MASLRDLATADLPVSSLRQASMATGITPEQAALQGAQVSDPFSQGAAGAIQGTFSGLKGLGAGVQDALGFDPTDAYASAARDAELAGLVGPRISKLGDIHGAGDAAAYALGQAGTMAPFIAMGAGGGLVGRGLNRALGMGLESEAAAHLGATGSFIPSMAGEQIAQMHELAPEMSPQERLARGLGVGTLQAAAAAVPGMAVTRAPGVQPFWRGVAQNALTGGTGMAALDAVGQAHRTTYDPNYQFDPTQTLEAGVAGAVGTAPYAIPGAAVGQLGQSGVDVGRFGKQLAGKATGADYDPLINGAKKAGAAAMDGLSWAGKETYDKMPEPLKQVADYLAAGGEVTKEYADALKPYADKLADRAKDALSEWWNDSHDAKSGYLNGVDAVGKITEAVDQVITGIQADDNVPNPLKKAIENSKARTDGEKLEEVASKIADPYSWVSEEVVTARDVQRIDTEMANVGRARPFASAVLSFLDGRGENGARAEELRAMAKKIQNAQTLTPEEGKAFWVTAQQVLRSANDSDALDHVLNIGNKVKISKGADGKASVEMLSRQKDVLNKTAREAMGAIPGANQMMINRIASRIQTGPLLEKGVTLEMKRIRKDLESQGFPPEVFDAAERALHEKIESLKNEGVIPRYGREGSMVSEAFRNAVKNEVRESFESLGFEDIDTKANALTDFVAKLAEGEEGYTDRSAAKVRAKFESLLGEEGGALFDRVIHIAQNEFGGVGDPRGERVAGLYDVSRSLGAAGAAARKLLKGSKFDVSSGGSKEEVRQRSRALEDLLSDIDDARLIDERRGGLDADIQALERRAATLPIGSNDRFELNGYINELRKEGQSTGFEHLKNKWVSEGVVEAKNFEKLVSALESYGMHPDRLTRPEKRAANHATSANHQQETIIREEGRDTSEPVRHDEVDEGMKYTDSGDEYQKYLAERAEAKYGTQGEEQRMPAIFWGTNAFNEGGHKPEQIGAPLSRHPAGDSAKEWNKLSSEYTNAVEEAHAKYGHRVTKAHAVGIHSWASEMVGMYGHTREKWMNAAMDALLKHDQERLKNERLTADDKKWIAARAALAEELGDRQNAGRKFFENKMNRNYRYYKMEQGDMSNLSYSAEQLRHGGYGPKEGESTADWVARQQKKDGEAFDADVYKNSLFPVKDADGNTMDVDMAKLVMDAMRRHQPGDIVGVGEKNKADLKHEMVTAFLNVVSTLMTADGMHKTDPLGLYSGENSRMLEAFNRSPRESKTRGETNVVFDPNLVIFRDPSGRVTQELGEHVKNHSVKRVYTVKDLMEIKGVDESLRKMVERGTPGALSEADMARLAPETKGPGFSGRKPISQAAAEESAARSLALANARGIARAGGTLGNKTVDIDVHGLLVRMLERNGYDAYAALHEGHLPENMAAMLIREGLKEMEGAGYKINFAADVSRNDLVLYYRRYGDKQQPVTLGSETLGGSTFRALLTGDKAVVAPRNMEDALLQELAMKIAKQEVALGKTAKAQREHDLIERAEKQGDLERDISKMEREAGRPANIEQHVKTVPIDEIHPIELERRPLTADEREQGFRTYKYSSEAPDHANQYDANDVENFRIAGALREYAEMAGGKARDVPMFDRSEVIKDESAWGKKAYGQSENGEHVVTGAKPKRPGSLPEPKPELTEEQLAAQRKAREELPDSAESLHRRLKEAGADKFYEVEAFDRNDPSSWSPQFRKLLDAISEERMRLAREQNDAAGTGDAAIVPGEGVLPLDAETQKANAKIQSTEVRTNQRELEDRAFREESRAIQRRRAEEEQAAKIDVTSHSAHTAPMPPEDVSLRLANQPKRTESAPKEPAAPVFDAKAEVDKLTAGSSGKMNTTAELINRLPEDQLKQVLLNLPPKRGVVGTDAEQVINRMNGTFKHVTERLGLEFNGQKFVDPKDLSFSRQRTTDSASAHAESEEMLRDFHKHFFGDAFKFEFKPNVTDGEGNAVSGKFTKDTMTSIVSAMASDRLGTLAHEGWHGVETLLGQMGEHGQRVLDDIYQRVSTPEIKAWLKERFAGDEGVLGQLGSEKERAAFTFQLIANGETMPKLAPEARTTMQKIIDWVRTQAEKLGLGFTTNEERANNFFEAMHKGEFAKNFENAAAVRRLLGEKNGDAAMHNISKAIKPLAEGFEKVFGHTSDRIRALDIPAYNEIMEKFSGANGKGGYLTDHERAEMHFANQIGLAVEGMNKEQQQAWFNSKEYSKFVTRMRQYVEQAMSEGGVPPEVKGKVVNSLYNKVDSFNVDRVDSRFEEFVTDLIQHGGYKGRAGEARQIANDIADRGYFYDGETKLFADRPDLLEKWQERDPVERATRLISVATKMAERMRHFGYKDEKLNALKEAGDKLADNEGKQLIQDYIDAIDGKLGSMSRDMKKLQGGLLFIQNVHALPLAVFSQMLEPLQLAMRKNAMGGSLDALFRGIRDLPRTFDALNKKVMPDYWEKLSYQVGSAPHRIVNDVMTRLMNGMHLSGTVGKLNDKFFRYNFMEQWNRSMHVEATKHAVEFMKEAARGLHGENSDRFLKELGVTREEILGAIKEVNDSGKTYETLELTPKIERAIVQYVEEAMAHPDVGSNAMWMNDPRFALLAQMKRFTFSHSKYVLDRGMNEMRLGNMFPVAPAIIAMPWMLAADGLRDTLAMRSHPERASWGLWEYAKHSFERAGHAGRGQFFNDAMNAAGRGSSPVEALAGPSAEMFGELARGAHSGHLIDKLIEYTPGSAVLPGF